MNKSRFYESIAQALDEAEVTIDADVSEGGIYCTLPSGEEWVLRATRVQ